MASRPAVRSSSPQMGLGEFLMGGGNNPGKVVNGVNVFKVDPKKAVGYDGGKAYDFRFTFKPGSAKVDKSSKINPKDPKTW